MNNSNTPHPVMLLILDGWGLAPDGPGNAVTTGHTPNFDRLWKVRPHTQLSASGGDVGLQNGVMGNSEVGHLNIGAGRIVWQDSLLIDQTINDGSFFENENLLKAIEHAKAHNSRLHLMGLMSNGSVHSSETHYLALIRMAARHGLRGDQLCFHAFTDGRDTAPHGGRDFMARVLREMALSGCGAVASVVGRYWAMDRDKRWSRVRQAYECLTEGKGHVAPDAISAVTAAYERGETDEFIGATVICDADGKPRPRIEDNDAVIFFNYRSDRGRELSQLFLDDDFDQNLPDASTLDDDERERARFHRETRPKTFFVTMTRYDAEMTCPIAFEPRQQRDGIGEILAKHHKTQLRMAETEKYPHVTYFFSGGIETPWEGEERILAASPQVATYDLQPEMSAGELMDKAVESIKGQKFDFIVLNFANPDMVGHTGVMEAAVKAVETVDVGLGRIAQALDEVGGAAVVIADHGNCEQMIDPKTGGVHTAHTTNPVPCILLGKGLEAEKLRSGGRLADVAPTLLGLLDLPQPDAMTGIDLRGAAPQQVDELDTPEHDDTLSVLRQTLAKLSDLQKLYALLGVRAANDENWRGRASLLEAMSVQVQDEAAQLSARVDQTLSEMPAPDAAALSLPEIIGAARELETELQVSLQDKENFSDEVMASQSRVGNLTE